MAKRPESPPPAAAPSADVAHGLRYGLSIPERLLRSTAGVVGGALRESAAVLVPQAFRDASTYQAFIGQMLDFMAEDLGGVDRDARPNAGAKRPDQFVARKAVGNFIDITSLATLHLSPMLVLAVVSDVAYGSKAYLGELAEELERRGVIENAARIEQADDLLDAVAAASGRMATAFDTPPLSVDGLRETIEQARAALREVDAAGSAAGIGRIVPEIELQRLWDAIQDTARRQGVDPLALSGAMTLHALGGRDGAAAKVGRGALSSVRVAGALLDRHVVDHYRGVLADIDERGFHAALAEIGRPYAQAVWRNFARDRSTATERFLAGGGIGRAWSKLSRRASRHDERDD